jgi:hypothetical protein
MPIKLISPGGGSVSIDVPSTANTFTLTAPARTANLVTTGDTSTVSEAMLASAAVTPTKLSQPMTLMTAQTASGSSVNFTSIPSWVKRITLQMRQVSFAASGAARVQLGTSSGLVTTGYSTGISALVTTPAIQVSTFTNGIGGFSTNDGTTTIVGTIVITLLDTNTWVSDATWFRTNDNIVSTNHGHIALSETLDRISLVATTSTFDAGTVNVLYEG